MQERFIIATHLHKDVSVWLEPYGWETIPKDHPGWVENSRIFSSRNQAEMVLATLQRKFSAGKLAQAASVFDLDEVWQAGVLDWKKLRREETEAD